MNMKTIKQLTDERDAAKAAYDRASIALSQARLDAFPTFFDGPSRYPAASVVAVYDRNPETPKIALVVSKQDAS